MGITAECFGMTGADYLSEVVKNNADPSITRKSSASSEDRAGAQGNGQLSVLLLTYVITQSDRRLCAVEGWVKAHQQILELSTGWSIGEKDTSDDRKKIE
ncbi:hypothetical protein NUACC21_33140 [Scytonema sp. NUACC21]